MWVRFNKYFFIFYQLSSLLYAVLLANICIEIYSIELYGEIVYSIALLALVTMVLNFGINNFGPILLNADKKFLINSFYRVLTALFIPLIIYTLFIESITHTVALVSVGVEFFVPYWWFIYYERAAKLLFLSVVFKYPILFLLMLKAEYLVGFPLVFFLIYISVHNRIWILSNKDIVNVKSTLREFYHYAVQRIGGAAKDKLTPVFVGQSYDKATLVDYDVWSKAYNYINVITGSIYSFIYPVILRSQWRYSVKMTLTVLVGVIIILDILLFGIFRIYIFPEISIRLWTLILGNILSLILIAFSYHVIFPRGLQGMAMLSTLVGALVLLLMFILPIKIVVVEYYILLPLGVELFSLLLLYARHIYFTFR